jgi:hypothetical protein
VTSSYRLTGGRTDEVSRTAHYQRKAQIYAAAQRAGILDDDLEPAPLVFIRRLALPR